MIVHCSVETSQCTFASLRVMNASFVTSPSVMKMGVFITFIIYFFVCMFVARACTYV